MTTPASPPPSDSALQPDGAGAEAAILEALARLPELVLVVDGRGVCHACVGSLRDRRLPPPEAIAGLTLAQVFPAAVARRLEAAATAARTSGAPGSVDIALGTGATRQRYAVSVVPTGTPMTSVPTGTQMTGVPTGTQIVGMPTGAPIKGVPTDGQMTALPAGAQATDVPAATQDRAKPATPHDHATPEGAIDRVVLRLRACTDADDRPEPSALLAEVMQRMTNLVLVLDAEDRVLWANPAFETVSGWSLKAVRGKRPADRLVGPQTDRQVLRRLVASLAARRSDRGELQLQARDGTGFWAEVTVQPLSGQRGADRRVLVIMTDISERKRQELDLRRLAEAADAAHTRLQEAVESLNDGFVLYDPDDRMVICNRRFREINAEVADLIVPGVTQQDLIRAGMARGMYDSAGDEPPEAQTLLDAMRDPAFVGTLRYRNGRIIAVHSIRMADGSHVGLRSDITAIKHAEQRLNDIIRGAGVGTWERDLPADTLVVNDQWFAMLGQTPEAIDITDPAVRARLIHPEDGPRVRRELARVREGDSDQIATEFRLRHREGHWVHVLSLGRLLSRDPAGRPQRMSGIDIDITARRQAEERLSAILGAAAVGTWQLDWAAERVTIDDAYAAMLGYRREALGSFGLAQFQSMVHPDDLVVMRARTAALKETGEDRISHEFRMRHRDGRWVWILSQARILRWAEPGVPAEESGVHVDITEAKAREFALAEAKAALEAALDARRDAEQRIADIAEVSDEWFWEWDTDGRLTYISSGFERATGLPRDRVIDTGPEALERLGFAVTQGADALATALAARDRFSDLVLRTRHALTGAPVWIRLGGAPQFDRHGRFIGYRGVGTNVSALIAATERAEAASQAKSRFLATMSHELRTPMTGVLGMAELLGESVADPELRGMVDTIRESGEGLLTILDDILDLAKIEAGKMTIEAQPFAPADLARRIEGQFAPRAETRGLRLRLRTTSDCRHLRQGDPHRILQILNNLVGNALKFTERGAIDIDFACPDPETLRIVVADTGIGMTAEQAQRAFDEFEQAEGSTARRFGGTGLGLSITRGLVTLMGGTIALTTEPGAGTRVEVTLPLPPAAAPMPLADTDAPDLAHLRLLVADDNPTNRAILRRMLEDAGATVTLARDGASALAAFRPGDFDLLLIDISMPVLDGIAALAAIRARERAAGVPPTPALAVTANAMAHQIEVYAAAGFAGHLAKPFRKAELIHTVAARARQSDRAPG